MSLGYLEIRQQRLDGLRQAAASALNGVDRIVLEVGCGHGHFLTAFADAHPGRVCLGVDRDGERINRALRKQARSLHGNVHFVRGDVELLLEALPEHIRISDTYVLFPDPWPKLRHRKHRVMQDAFLSLLVERHLPQGRLMFRTDHTGYFDETAAILAAHPRWTLVEGDWPFEFETIFQQRAARHQSLIAQPTQLKGN